MKIHTENEASVRESEGKSSNILEYGIRFPDGTDAWDLRFIHYGFDILDVRTPQGRRETQESYLKSQKKSHLKHIERLVFITRLRKIRFEQPVVVVDKDFTLAS